MVVCDAYVFPGFLTPVLTQVFFPKPLTTFLTCLCRGERRKKPGKKSRLNRESNSQAPGHESDKLTTEPPGRGSCMGREFGKNRFCRWKVFEVWILGINRTECIEANFLQIKTATDYVKEVIIIGIEA